MSQDDLIPLEGVVTRVLGDGIMEIHCDNDIIVIGAVFPGG